MKNILPVILLFLVVSVQNYWGYVVWNGSGYPQGYVPQAVPEVDIPELFSREDEQNLMRERGIHFNTRGDNSDG